MKALQTCVLLLVSFIVGFFSATCLNRCDEKIHIETRDIIRMTRSPVDSGLTRRPKSVSSLEWSKDWNVDRPVQTSVQNPNGLGNPSSTLKSIRDQRSDSEQKSSSRLSASDDHQDHFLLPQSFPGLLSTWTDQVDNKPEHRLPNVFSQPRVRGANNGVRKIDSTTVGRLAPGRVTLTTVSPLKNTQISMSWTLLSGQTSTSSLEQDSLASHRQQGHLKPEFVQEEEMAEDSAIDMTSAGQRNKCRHLRKSFPCQNCICSYTQHGKLIADCLGLLVWSIPTQLPPQTWKLNMDGNALKRLNTNDILLYSELTEVTISFNKKFPLQIERGYEVNQTSNILSLSITFCQAHIRNDKSFSVMSKLINLNLSGNEIKQLTNLTFEGLTNLRLLNLSHNKISVLEVATFDNLSLLNILDLSHNYLHGPYERMLPPRLFEGLQSLRELYLQENNEIDQGQPYPNHALAKLTNLQKLYIDGLADQTFGPEVKVLRHFKYLFFGSKGGRCSIRTITKDFFKNIPNIEMLVLNWCLLTHISSDAYTYVPNLQRLSLSHMDNYDLLTALDEIRALQNSSLKSLSLIKMYLSTYPCRFLNKTHGKYLTQIPLEELDLSENRLALLGNDFLTTLPRTLKKIVLRRNRLSPKIVFVFRIRFLNNLLELDISEQNEQWWRPERVDLSYDSENDLVSEDTFGSDESHRNCTVLKSLSSTRRTDSSSCENNMLETQEIDDTLHDDQSVTTAVLDVASSDQTLTELNANRISRIGALPPQLRVLKARNFITFGFLLLVEKHKGALEEVDLSDNFLSEWGMGTMFPTVKRANLNNNYCTKLRPGFFKINNSMVHFSIRDNFLGPVFSDDRHGDIFSRLQNLIYLDISRNLISHLPHLFFRGLINLQRLNISNNKLQTLDIDFSFMNNLKYLDLNRNSIIWISKTTRDTLDKIATEHDLYVDLTDNLLPCTCSGLEILHWLATTNVCLVNIVPLKCQSDSGRNIEVHNIDAYLKTLQQNCASKVVIIVSITAAIGLFFILVTLSLMYKYRWKLRYLKNLAMAKWFGFAPVMPQGVQYKFDAYLLYTESSFAFVKNHCIHELEVNRGHTLCIADRDFMPGTYIVSDIVSAIQSSAKTVPLIEPGFDEDDFAAYGVQMAVMEELHTNRHVLHLSLYKPVEIEELSRDLLQIFQRDDYTAYPPEEESTEAMRKMFWDQLSNAIGHQDYSVRETTGHDLR